MLHQEHQNFRHQLTQLPDVPLTNPKKHPLTPEKLRFFQGYEAVTDDEAHDLIRQFDYVSRIFLAFHDKINKLCA